MGRNLNINQHKIKIACVIVTHNRLEFLKNCINSVMEQDYKVDEIIVVNNSSTDGTSEWLSSQSGLSIINQENLGSSGGQYAGIKYAYNKGYNWVWTMDDDVICSVSALSKLIEKIDLLDNPGFLVSNVFNKENYSTNVPIIDTRKSKAGTKEWNKYLGNKCVRIREATFVSLLINRYAIDKCGLPIKSFFIWADDYEYTLRISQSFFGYLAGDSVVHHLRNGNENLTIGEETAADRIRLYFYFYRNGVFLVRKYYPLHKKMNYFVKNILSDGIIKSILSGKNVLLKLYTVTKGSLYGLFFRPYQN